MTYRSVSCIFSLYIIIKGSEADVARVMVVSLDGRREAAILTARSRLCQVAEAKANPSHRYADMTGHASYDLAFRDASLYAWLLRQRKAG